MTAPRRALPAARPSPARRISSWLRTAWQPAALASAACLLLAGLWPAPAAPPTAPPAPEQSAEAWTEPPEPEPPDPEPLQLSAASESPGTTPDPVAHPVASAQPLLRMAALGISAPVREVGVVGYELEIPPDPGDVGIWRDGAMPGDRSGTVLVSGHVSWQGERGALWPLAGAGPGEAIELVTPDGKASRWVVSTVEHLPREADHPGLFTTTGQHRLVVVTCGGPVVAGHYRDLVAVVALPA